MLDSNEQKAVVDVQRVSRRDFLKFCSLMIGGLALPHTFASTFEEALTAPKPEPAITKP